MYMYSEHCDQEVRDLRMRTQGEEHSVLYTVIRRGRKGVENIGERDSLYCTLLPGDEARVCNTNERDSLCCTL